MTKKATVGDVIKSYDFQRRKDCYILGQVVSVKNDVIVAKVIRAISENKEYRFPDTEFSTYQQGTGMFDDTWQRIEVVG